VRADVVARAMRLIADGEVERSGVPGLAARLGYSERQLHRLLVGELGVGPLALARAQRAQTARLLLETTDLPVADVAFAAGFASIRQFNDTVREVFATTPTDLRTSRTAPASGSPGTLTLRLAARAPFDAAEVLLFLGAHAVPGLEEWDGTTFTRVLDLPHGPAVVALSPAADGAPAVVARLALGELRDLGVAVSRCRRLLDLDADPEAVDAALAADPSLAPLVAAAPGRRVPASPDATELAVRAVLGQQVSVAGARTLTARLLTAAGTPLPEPVGTLTHAFPGPEALAAADLGAVGLTGARRRTVTGLAGALAEGRVRLDAGADRAEAERSLLALPGIGPWTAALVALRGLGDPDVWLPRDLALRRSLESIGSSDTEAATRWRPWRSYAVLHLWSLAAPSFFTRPPTPLTRHPAPADRSSS
jgi:AraC family transcriptional regulator of adaptative response / DNA-3-methyladenine glycosylase II